jgi:hypothetical protein
MGRPGVSALVKVSSLILSEYGFFKGGMEISRNILSTIRMNEIKAQSKP